MFQTLLEEESDVNRIVDAGKVEVSFIEIGFTAIEELIHEGEAIGKWYGA